MVTSSWGRRAAIVGVGVALVLVTGFVTAPRSSKALAATNPTPLTDVFAQTIALGTGGTATNCAVSGMGITVICHNNVTTMPSALPTASGVTYAHHIFCRGTCGGSLLVHEMVHVAQFEAQGDTFGPLYLVEAAQHGTGCDNVYERPAYQTSGQCL